MSYRLDFAEDVVILVGETERRSVVHKNILCQSSTFFKAACSGQWLEATERLVRLPEANVEAFHNYACWLYEGTVELLEEDERSRTIKNYVGKEYIRGGGYWPRVLSGYVLGDQLGDARYCNALVDNVKRELVALPVAATVKVFWPVLPSGCAMRRLLIDLWTMESDPGSFERYIAVFPTEFVFEAAAAAVRERNLTCKEKRPGSRPACHYHEHRSEADKCI